MSKPLIQYSLHKSVEWDAGDETVSLDGDFTAAELEEIAAHMKARNAPKDASKVVESRPENFGNSDFP